MIDISFQKCQEVSKGYENMFGGKIWTGLDTTLSTVRENSKFK
jgi:hypothetical protein